MPTARSSSRSTRRKLVSHWWTRRPARSVTSASTRTLTCTWWEAVKDVRDQVRHRLRPHEHLRVVLDTEYVPHKGDGGEARAAMRCFHRLARLVPGAQGVNYDMAMRGCASSAGSSSPRFTTRKDPLGNRQEWHIEDQEVENLKGQVRTLSVYARDGAPGLRVLTDTGEVILAPLTVSTRSAAA